MKDWFKQYTNTAIVLGTILPALFWFHSRIDKRFEKIDQRFVKMDERFSTIEKDMAVIKAVLVMKNIMPTELAKKEERRK